MGQVSKNGLSNRSCWFKMPKTRGPPSPGSESDYTDSGRLTDVTVQHQVSALQTCLSQGANISISFVLTRKNGVFRDYFFDDKLETRSSLVVPKQGTAQRAPRPPTSHTRTAVEGKPKGRLEVFNKKLREHNLVSP